MSNVKGGSSGGNGLLVALGLGAVGVAIASFFGGKSSSGSPSTPVTPREPLTLYLKKLPNTPYPAAPISALVYVPSRFTVHAPWTVLVYARGNGSNVTSTFRTKGLGKLLEETGRNVLLVLPEREPTGSGAGTWENSGAAQRFIREVLGSPEVQAVIGDNPPRSVVFMSHSGGYNAVAAAITSASAEKATSASAKSPELPTSGVVLFDSLYGRTSDYFNYVKRGGVFFNISWTQAASTTAQSKILRSQIEAAHIPVGTFNPDAEPIPPYSVGFGVTKVFHDSIPAAYFSRFVRRLCP